MSGISSRILIIRGFIRTCKNQYLFNFDGRNIVDAEKLRGIGFIVYSI
jgi:hypothetical protein